MKILFVVHQFFPEYSTGTEILLLSTAKSMGDVGHDVAVFTANPVKNSTFKPQDTLTSYVYEGIKVWSFDHAYILTAEQPNIAESEYYNRNTIPLFKQVMNELSPDVVHVFHLQRVSSSVLDICYKWNVPVIYSPTDFWLLCPTAQLLLPNGKICLGADKDCENCLQHLSSMRLTGWQSKLGVKLPSFFFLALMRLSKQALFQRSSTLAQVKALSLRANLLRESCKRINKILIPSTIMRTKLRSFFGDDDNFIQLPFGIDLPQAMKKKESKALRVGFIGTFLEHKGAHILSESIQRVPKDMNIHIYMYGDLSLFPDYASKIKQHATMDERIHLEGTFMFQKINQIFSTLDVLVIPSTWHENTPLVAYAAKAYACPIISSRIEGMMDVMSDGKSGYFFTPNAVGELADILQKLYVDQDKLKELSKKIPRPYTMQEYSDKLLSIYENTLMEKKR